MPKSKTRRPPTPAALRKMRRLQEETAVAMYMNGHPTKAIKKSTGVDAFIVKGLALAHQLGTFRLRNVDPRRVRFIRQR